MLPTKDLVDVFNHDRSPSLVLNKSPRTEVSFTLQFLHKNCLKSRRDAKIFAGASSKNVRARGPWSINVFGKRKKEGLVTLTRRLLPVAQMQDGHLGEGRATAGGTLVVLQ